MTDTLRAQVEKLCESNEFAKDPWVAHAILPDVLDALDDLVTVTREREEARRKADNHAFQITYICEEAAKVSGVPCGSPSDVVWQIRTLKQMADSYYSAKAALTEALARVKALEAKLSAIEDVCAKSEPPPLTGQHAVTSHIYSMTPSTRKELRRILAEDRP